MPDTNDFYEVGYRKPPSGTRFVKGKSGNPKGRPKGSKNLASVLAKVGREPVRVSGKNGSRTITKLEACVLQLINQAASGELRATREFLHLVKAHEDSEQDSPGTLVPDERDRAVMASIIERIRQCGDQLAGTTEATDPEAAPTGEE